METQGVGTILVARKMNTGSCYDIGGYKNETQGVGTIRLAIKMKHRALVRY
jgi:hypothetical protein